MDARDHENLIWGSVYSRSICTAAVDAESALAPRSLTAIRIWPPESVTVSIAGDAPVDATGISQPDVHRRLLGNTQAYLRVLAQKRRPGQELCQAWERFFAAYNPLVVRAVRSRFADADRDDCAQEVWCEIIRCLVRREHNPQLGRFYCWLSQVIRFKVIDLLRAAARDPNCEPLEPDTVVCHRSSEPSVLLERSENRHIVHNAITVLSRCTSATSFQTAQLGWIEGHSVRDIAGSLDLTPAQVRYRQYRARKKLRRLLEPRIK